MNIKQAAVNYHKMLSLEIRGIVRKSNNSLQFLLDVDKVLIRNKQEIRSLNSLIDRAIELVEDSARKDVDTISELSDEEVEDALSKIEDISAEDMSTPLKKTHEELRKESTLDDVEEGGEQA